MTHRKALYAGTFLAAAGAVMLLGQGEAAREAIAPLLALWPLAVVAIGVALIVRHTRFGLAGGLMAAAVPGLLFGGTVAAAPEFTAGCAWENPGGWTTRDGTLGTDARVDLVLDCGEIDVVVGPGGSWRVESASAGGRTPSIEASGDRLRIDSGPFGPRAGFGASADVFRVTLPADARMDLAAQVNAGRGAYTLAGGHFGTVSLDVNAGDAHVDLTGATLERLAMDVNAAAASVVLPSGVSFSAAIDVNAAAATICAPPDLGLRITETTVLGDSDINGLVRANGAWETPGYADATYRADVSLSVNVGSVDINPEGGCK